LHACRSTLEDPPALALYRSEGFCEVGRRRHYYPAPQGREDALILAVELMTDGRV
jgi:[SSU ribosomal protein S18P]-alanine acetyltransferase (EC 2.3.1.128)